MTAEDTTKILTQLAEVHALQKSTHASVRRINGDVGDLKRDFHDHELSDVREFAAVSNKVAWIVGVLTSVSVIANVLITFWK